MLTTETGSGSVLIPSAMDLPSTQLHTLRMRPSVRLDAGQSLDDWVRSGGAFRITRDWVGGSGSSGATRAWSNATSSGCPETCSRRRSAGRRVARARRDAETSVRAASRWLSSIVIASRCPTRASGALTRTIASLLVPADRTVRDPGACRTAVQRWRCEPCSGDRRKRNAPDLGALSGHGAGTSSKGLR